MIPYSNDDGSGLVGSAPNRVKIGTRLRGGPVMAANLPNGSKVRELMMTSHRGVTIMVGRSVLSGLVSGRGL